MLSLPSLDFIPGWLYVPLFNWLIFFLMMVAVLQSATGSIYQWNSSVATRKLGGLLIVFLILYIGLRPTHNIKEYIEFADTFGYAANFRRIQMHQVSNWFSSELFESREWLYLLIVQFSAAVGNEHLMFLLCAVIYVWCSYKFCNRIFGTQWFLPFLLVCSMFSFFAFGVNGVRNGMSASLFILALSYREKKWIAVLLCFCALGCHRSLMLLMVGALLAWVITNPKYYIAGWIASIIATLALGHSIGNWIGSSGIIEDDRLARYVIRDNDKEMYYTGFRWDFLLYSSLPVVSGAYFIFKQQYQDKFYIYIYNIYLVANSAWILMMYAGFSNRFAQLSWFVMPIVLIYPWFKKIFFSRQGWQLSKFLLVCYAYTFYANIVMRTFFWH